MHLVYTYANLYTPIYSHILTHILTCIGMKNLLYIKIEDAGHHSFNQFAVSAPYISSKLGAYVYAYVEYYTMHRVCTYAINSKCM